MKLSGVGGPKEKLEADRNGFQGTNKQKINDGPTHLWGKHSRERRIDGHARPEQSTGTRRWACIVARVASGAWPAKHGGARGTDLS